MIWTKFRLLEAAVAATLLPVMMCAIHLVEGTRPLITEFDEGAIYAIVFIRLMDAARAQWPTPKPDPPLPPRETAPKPKLKLVA